MKVDVGSCLLCGSVGNTRIYPRGSNATIQWCRSCDLGFTSPVPLVDYSAYTNSEPRNFELWTLFAERLIRWATSVKLQPPTSWLDYGAGSGELIIAAKRAGLHAIGIDLDDDARAVAHGRDALVLSSLAELDSGASFDIISASHTLEHVLDPIGVLRDLSRRLTDGGLLVVVQPNAKGLVVRLLRARWPGWVPSQHLWHWTVRSMTETVTRAELQVVATANGSLSYRVSTFRSMFPVVAAITGKATGRGDEFYMAVQQRKTEA